MSAHTARSNVMIAGRLVKAGEEIPDLPAPRVDFRDDAGREYVVAGASTSGHKRLLPLVDRRPDLEALVERGLACPPKPGRCADCTCGRKGAR